MALQEILYSKHNAAFAETSENALCLLAGTAGTSAKDFWQLLRPRTRFTLRASKSFGHQKKNSGTGLNLSAGGLECKKVLLAAQPSLETFKALAYGLPKQLGCC